MTGCKPEGAVAPSSSDFRSSEPEDRVTALRAIIEAKGNALPAPDICHGYANGCTCPVCQFRSQQQHNRLRRLAA